MSVKDFASVKEYRRNIAIKLLNDEHWTQQKIADFLEVSQSSISHWFGDVSDDPVHGLNDKSHPGAEPKIPDKKLELALAMIFDLTPAAFGYNEDRWTVDRITRAFKELTGTEYHPSRMRILLHQYGYSPQKPALRATQRNEEAIREWEKNTWPNIKKGY
ncbi:winged helix-turn-helix domain-containing protein [Photobacterium sagamiensis]|uniref:winged helix-turn-helix domain-containing protein n=1 Tax=Photobacterium sagamiensis TaxID=2910241 RepID=UPI003D0C831D